MLGFLCIYWCENSKSHSQWPNENSVTLNLINVQTKLMEKTKLKIPIHRQNGQHARNEQIHSVTELDRRILFDCFVVVVVYIFSKIHNQKDFLIYAVLAFYISIRLVDRIHIYAFVAKVEAMCSEKQQLTNSPKLETNCKIQ